MAPTDLSCCLKYHSPLTPFNECKGIQQQKHLACSEIQLCVACLQQLTAQADGPTEPHGPRLARGTEGTEGRKSPPTFLPSLGPGADPHISLFMTLLQGRGKCKEWGMGGTKGISLIRERGWPQAPQRPVWSAHTLYSRALPQRHVQQMPGT